MTVIIRVITKCYVISLFKCYQVCHRIGGGAVHADFAVVIKRHKRKRRIHILVDHIDIQAPNISYRLPEVYSGASHRISCHFQPGAAYSLDVNDLLKCLDVGNDVVDQANIVRGKRIFEIYTFHIFKSVGKYLVRPFFDQRRNVSVCRASGRRVVFKASIFRGIMRRRYDYAVSDRSPETSVPGEYRMGDHGRRRVAKAALDPHKDTVCCEYFHACP